MKLSKSATPVLRQILLYALSVFLPIALIFLSLVYSGSILKQEIIGSNTASVELLQSSLDSTFLELQDTITYAGRNPELYRYSILSDPVAAQSCIKDIVSTHSALTDMILYIRDSDSFCSANSSFTSDSIQSQHFIKDMVGSGGTAEHWIQMMQNASDTSYWASAGNGQSSNLYLISPLFYMFHTDGSTVSRCACMVIRQDHIRDILQASQTASEEGMLLLSPTGLPLSKLTSRMTDGYVSEICDYIHAHPEICDEGFAELPDSNILLFVSRSSETGLIYVRFLPKDIAYSALQTQGVFSVAFLVLAILLGIILITTNTRRGYRPMLRITNWLRNSTVPDNAAVPQAFKESSSLPVSANIPRQSMIDHLLAELISGSFSSEESFQKSCAALNIRLDKPYFAVCSLLVEEDGSGAPSVEFDRIFDAIRAGLPFCYQLQAKDLLSDGKLVLVINSDSNDPALYRDTMQAMMVRLQEQEQLTVSIGMGSFCDSRKLAARSYIESTAALDYRLVYGKNSLITPEISSAGSPVLSVSYPSYELEHLDAALLSRNTEDAISALQAIRSVLKLKSCDLHTSKYICYEISSIINKHKHYADIINLNSAPLNIADLVDQESVESFFAELVALLETSTNMAAAPATLVQSGMGARLVEYIDAHCLSYDFQIKNMAEHFAISPQYMRKLFKAQTGVSLSEYVSNKRIEKSTFLLTQTDMSLQDITAEIGNSDISGFVRFFKQKTGLTPGQYRKAHKQQD